MNEIMKNLQEAFDMLSTIPVQGQNVDVMYNARVKLRVAYKIAADKNKSEEVSNNG